MHTVYVPADRYTPELPIQWGRAARQAAAGAGGVEALAVDVGIAPDVAAAVAPLVEQKLAREPIEDLRIDFEDGYGDRGDHLEDADAVRAAKRVAAATGANFAPPFIGIRFKSFEAPTRARGIRTLDLFLTTLMDQGGLPDGLMLTLPKVSTVSQVEAMVDVAEALERAHGLPHGRLRFEVQVETPQLVLGADGAAPVARLALAAPGRIAGLHYGTYDYSAALGIAAPYQSLEHPAADHAKNVMQVAVAGTGIRLSDGSTNILPVGDRAPEAWRLHARLVRRSLERGFPQGWDLHPAQLPTRFIATYAYYRDGYPEASARLRHVHDRHLRRRARRAGDGAGARRVRPPRRAVRRDHRGRGRRRHRHRRARARRPRDPEAHDDMSGCRGARGHGRGGPMSYYTPPGGLPAQTELLTDRAIVTEAYTVIPKGVLRDIVTSNLPGFTRHPLVDPRASDRGIRDDVLAAHRRDRTGRRRRATRAGGGRRGRRVRHDRRAHARRSTGERHVLATRRVRLPRRGRRRGRSRTRATSSRASTGSARRTSRSRASPSRPRSSRATPTSRRGRCPTPTARGRRPGSSTPTTSRTTCT